MSQERIEGEREMESDLNIVQYFSAESFALIDSC
jgi:hypothetical protein